jgi:UrcA family protein
MSLSDLKLTSRIIVASLVLAGAQASAGTAIPSVTVQYGDLDTSAAPGAAALYARLHSGAREVCRQHAPDRSIAGLRRYDDCVQVALGRAIATVGRPAVSEYAAARLAKRRSARIEMAALSSSLN